MEFLGEGAHGAVYKLTTGGKSYAVKKIEDTDPYMQHLVEFDVMTRLRHPNIVNGHGIVVKEGAFHIFMELCEENLFQYNKRSLTNDRRTIIVDILKGVAFLHSQNVIHRDLYERNILMCGGVAKISDFGEAIIKLTPKMPHTVFYGRYRPPEIVYRRYDEETYDEKVDIWALGCLVYELLTRKQLFHDLADSKYAQQIESKIGRIPDSLLTRDGNYISVPQTEAPLEELPEPYKSLVIDMMAILPDKRPSAVECLDRLDVNYSRPSVAHIHSVNYIDEGRIERLDIEAPYKIEEAPRTEALSTIIKIQAHFKIPIDYFFLAADILDRYLSLTNSKEMMLYAYVALYISVKICGEERSYISDTLVDRFGKEKSAKALLDILISLNFHLYRKTLPQLFPQIDKKKLESCILEHQTPDEVV